MYWPDVVHLAQPAWAIISKWTKMVMEQTSSPEILICKACSGIPKLKEVIQKEPKGQDLISGV
jgi:hypothetical protein